MSTHTLTARDLLQFTGSEHWYRHALVRGVTFTDGVKHVADAGGAYWLIDEIAFAQVKPIIAHEAFQLWRLTLKENRSARLVCEDGNGRAVWRKHIPWTDFPMAELSLYCVNRVIHLPSEY